MAKMRILRILLATLVMATAIFPPLSRGQVVDGQQVVSASLLPSQLALVPGRPLLVGLLLRMAPGWHTYWRYGGDAGIPTKISWSLPEGFAAGPIEWPAPRLMVEPGDIWTYGYEGEVLLSTAITPPANLAPGEQITLRAKASWLACKEMCVPGSAELALTLPVSEKSEPANQALFQKFQTQIPSDGPVPYGMEWSRSKNALLLAVKGLPAGAAAEIFPLPADGGNAPHARESGPGSFSIPSDGEFQGVLAVGSGPERRAWMVQGGGPEAQSSGGGLWLALFYGFLGGLILNLMPCVLPVISLKVFGFIQQAGESPRKIFAHGLAFIGGIFTWFMALGTLVAVLKAGGTEVTWAFQFQNPWFNVGVGTVVFAFALNLFGVFEVVLPGRASTALESASSASGMGGSYFQGLFATLLATPCTAPFLGTALGFAFGQSAEIILAMFASVAAGMGFPYLLLTARPGWMRFLPKPGAWMERLKQFMGFPLLATLVWILGILGGQRGTEGVFWFLCFLLCLALACWLYGSFCGPLSKPFPRWSAVAVAALLLFGGGTYFLGQKFASAGQAETGGIDWIPFSPEELGRLQAAGKPVFVDFTADWCITCKFNERTAINTPTVRKLLAEKGIVPVRADWTNANPDITSALKKFGRVGVPFYVLYPAGKPDAPVVLPELLTEGILVEALEKL